MTFVGFEAIWMMTKIFDALAKGMMYSVVSLAFAFIYACLSSLFRCWRMFVWFGGSRGGDGNNAD